MAPELHALIREDNFRKFAMKTNHYVHLAAMAILSFVSMYFLMYSMTYSAGDVYNNLNQLYMAGLMTAPMVIIELGFMRHMFTNRRLNMAILVASVVAGVGFFMLIQKQAAIGDTQFLRSMIPHHSSAVLMCEEALLTDSRIRDLCRAIVANQRSEIGQMKEILENPPTRP